MTERPQFSYGLRQKPKWDKNGQGANFRVFIDQSGLNSDYAYILIALDDQNNLSYIGLCHQENQGFSALQLAFPEAKIVWQKERHPYLVRLQEFLKQGKPLPDWPVALHGTAFFKDIWWHMMNLHSHGPISYQDLASLAGRPKAFRAAARACSTNPLCFYIPCHLVIGSHGGLGGYAYGLEIKKALIQNWNKAIVHV